MKKTIKAYAALSKGQLLEPFEYEPSGLRPEEVEIAVSHCGICHSDLSMLENDWGMSSYPFVPGHEVVGTVTAVGTQAKKVRLGQKVGLGWNSGSCMACEQCLSGNHNLCPQGEGTIVKRYGGFAERVRCHWAFAVPLPESVDPATAGPLFCGGITVFNPLIQYGVKPTDRVGVIGIGGLGHLAVQFLNKWGCEVTAFTSSSTKREEALKLGAHSVLDSRDTASMKKIAGSLDLILSTVNVPLDWGTVLEALAPKGRLHILGAVLEPIPVPAFALLPGQKQVSGSPVGSPAILAQMLEFCARHKIAPITESFPLSKANDALEHLRSGNARYRVVLENDLAV